VLARSQATGRVAQYQSGNFSSTEKPQVPHEPHEPNESHESRDPPLLNSGLVEEPPMHTFTASEAKTRFGEFLDRVQREPVRVMRHDRVVGIMVSAEDYAAMRSFYADRLVRTMNETAVSAERAGLTPDVLAKLLDDEG